MQEEYIMKCVNAKLLLSGTLICLTLFVFVLLGSCGRGKTTAPTVGLEPVAPQVSRAVSRRNIPPLDELLRQLENLKKPSKADRRVWAKLKAEMRRWLILGYA